jgi:Protein of unknown function (DUF2852)
MRGIMSAADHQAYGNPNWRGPGPGPGQGPSGNPYWGPDHFQRWVHTGRPVLLAAMILGFIFWWPIGMVFLVLLIASRKFAWGFCGPGGSRDGWRRDGGVPPWAGWKSWSGWQGSRPSSGNVAFDEYRAETLRRLEEEQKEFTEFLDRLRAAKDKSEFDQFMSERRQRPEAPPPPPQS